MCVRVFPCHPYRLNLATGKVVKTSGPMPGLPDVITAHPGHGGGHLVSIEVVRNAMVDYMAENKWFKRVLYKVCVAYSMSLYFMYSKTCD